MIDTAPMYGVSEDLIGKAFPVYPDGVHVVTKGGIVRTPDGPLYRGRPEQIREDCEHSLRRLCLDAIALSQLLTVDPGVPIEESIGGLDDLRREGKVRHVGLSNVDIDELRRPRPSPRSSACRTASAWPSGRPQTCSKPAPTRGSPSCRGGPSPATAPPPPASMALSADERTALDHGAAP